MNLSLKGAGSRFAHLAGIAAAALIPGVSAKAKAEGDDKDEKDNKDDARAEGDDDGDEKDKDKSKSKSKAKADGDDDDEKCEAEDGDDDKDGDEKEKSKSKAKAQTYADGVKAENARWSTVMAHEGTAGRVHLACSLLHKTSMSAADVISTLADTPAVAPSSAKTERLNDRMRAANPPNPGPGGEDPNANADEATKLAAQIGAATAKARGEKPKAA